MEELEKTKNIITPGQTYILLSDEDNSWSNVDFFLSSRKGHTIFDCDWSSDVCSSDLRRRQVRPHLRPPGTDQPAQAVVAAPGGGRSEERRVGKEGRSRWSPDP